MPNIKTWLLFTFWLSNHAMACGDNRGGFASYVTSADHIVLAGVVSLADPGYRDFIAQNAENFDPELGLPIDISRRYMEFETETLHVFKGQQTAPDAYFHSPCMGKVKVGTLYIIFSNETADGHQAVSFDAYQFPEILDYLNKHSEVLQESSQN